MKFLNSNTFFLILALIICFGMMKLGPYLGYHLFYKPYVEREIEPLKERIKVLENTLNSKTNASVQLQ